LFEDPDDDWVKDTLSWWNKYVLFIPLTTCLLFDSHIFGTILANKEEEDHEPSTIDKIRAKRTARMAQQNLGHHNEQEPTSR
jgi:hypothetical protein